MKQFMRSLKGIAFDLYINLASESINSYGQMESEFLNRFCSARRVVSITELTNTRKWNNESVIDYNNHWRALSVECKDRLSEASAVKMCAQEMHWNILYAL